MKRSFLIVIGVAVLLGIVINFILSDPKFENLSDRITHAEKSNNSQKVESLSLEQLQGDPNNLDYNYNYIEAHFNLPRKKKKGKNSYEYRDDETIINYYQAKANSVNPIESDIGHYGSGLISVNLKEYESAMEKFLLVEDKKIKYWNNSIGNVYRHLDQDSLAEQHFHEEIHLRGNVNGATRNLSRLYLEQKNYEKLDRLIQNHQTRDWIPAFVSRKFYFLNGQYISYFRVLLTSVFGGLTFTGSLGAILILGVWIIYIRKLDIYEPEQWKPIILTVGLGMVFSLFTFILSDINQELFGFHLNGELINDFVYSVLGIGAVEELVKIIPLLLLIKYTRYVNESYDYIFYASLSALGFAFMENLLYFNQYQLHIISSRALLTSIGHMFMSSTVAYAFILNKYRYKNNSALRVLLFFFFASLGHGFYDFWLINEKVSDFSILSILFFISGISVWNSFKNNALNNSEFFDKKKKLNHQELSDFLVYGLSGVILFEYVALSLKFGPTAGNSSFFDSILSGAYILLFISSGLGQFKIKRGKWLEIRFWGTNKEQTMDGNPDEVLGQTIKLTPYSNHDYQISYLPNEGKVSKRYEIKSDSCWYLVQLKNPGSVLGFNKKYIFLRPKESGETIKKSFRILVGVYLIKEHVSVKKEEFERDDLEFIHWARAITV